MPASIARLDACRRPTEVLPDPVASITSPREPAATAASTRRPSIDTAAVIRSTGSAAVSVSIWRRPTLRRPMIRRSPSTSPSGPKLRLWNAVSELVCAFVTSSAAWTAPAITTSAP